MKNILSITLFFWILGAVSVACAQEVAVDTAAAPEKTAGWKKAGTEIEEAAHAVGEATAETSRKAWDATKEGSAEVWDATKGESKEAWEATREESAKAWKAAKEQSKTAWEKGKEKIHETTAPTPSTPKSD